MAVEISPNIIMPTKDFLVGVIYGFNLAKKTYNFTNPEVGQKENGSTNFFIGYWLELSCAKCGRLYCYDSPNDLPATNLICETLGCGNHIIAYNVSDSRLWKIGHLTF